MIFRHRATGVLTTGAGPSKAQSRPSLADYLLGYYGLARVRPGQAGQASGDPAAAAAPSESTDASTPPARQVRTLGDPILAAGTPEQLGSTLRTTQPRLSADGGTIGSLSIRVASLCGRRHAQAGMAREDAFAFRYTSDGTVIVAVADGLGDHAARFSAVGAQVASFLSCHLVCAWLEEGRAIDPDDACAKVSARMNAEASRFINGAYDDKSLATTLTIAWVSAQGAYRGFMVGDGGVFEITAGQATVIASGPGGTFAGPDVLPSSHAQPEPFSGTLDPGTALLLATDGLSMPMLSPDVSQVLGQSWQQVPSVLDFLYDISFERRGEADDRTGACVWFEPPEPAP